MTATAAAYAATPPDSPAPDAALAATPAALPEGAVARLGEPAAADAPDDELRERLVTAIAFSPDGATLVAGTADGTVTVFGVAGAAPRHTFRAHEGEINGIVYRPDGSSFLTASETGFVCEWPAPPDGPAAADLEPAIGGPPRRRELFAAELQALGRSRISAIDMSADGAKLAMGTGGLLVVDATTGQVQWPPLETDHTPASVAFSRDGKHLLVVQSVGWDDAVELWDVEAGRRAWQKGEGTEGVPGVGKSAFYDQAAFSPDGELAAVAVARPNRQAVAQVWKHPSGQTMQALRAKNAFITLAFSPDGRRLATGGGDGSGADGSPFVHVWDPRTGERLREFCDPAGRRVECLAFSPDGTKLATAGWGGTVTLWDVSEAAARD